jgi:hypothetical protein
MCVDTYQILVIRCSDNLRRFRFSLIMPSAVINVWIYMYIKPNISIRRKTVYSFINTHINTHRGFQLFFLGCHHFWVTETIPSQNITHMFKTWTHCFLYISNSDHRLLSKTRDPCNPVNVSRPSYNDSKVSNYFVFKSLDSLTIQM